MRKRKWLRVAGMVTLFLAAAIALKSMLFSSAQAQSNQQVVLTIEAKNDTISAGGNADFTVTMENKETTALNNMLLTLTLDGQVEKVKLDPKPGASIGVSTDSTRRQGNQLRWRGDLEGNGKLVFDVNAKTYPLAQTVTLTGEAGPAGGEPVVNANAMVVSKAYDLNPNDLNFAKVLLWSDGNAPAEGNNAEMLPRQEVGIELRFTNNSNVTVYTLLVDQMAGGALATEADATENTCRLDPIRSNVMAGKGFRVPVDALGTQFQSDETLTYAFLVRTEPGKTSVTRVRARVVGLPGCKIEGEAQAFSTAQGPATPDLEAAASNMTEKLSPKLEFIQSMLTLKPKLSGLVTLLLLLSDLGDAPDSSNHAALGTMIAYPPDVTANFPTVFGTAAGAVQGPKHTNSRPLHLGQRVSGELFADMGTRRNIDPPIDTADLDLHDDGVDLTLVTFQRCRVASIPVEVTVGQAAVDYVADDGQPLYLNIWLDANRDGDWDDKQLCDGLTAVEHIVVDQEFFPSTPGTLALTAPTSLIPLLPNTPLDAMWMRVMVSDEPSVKIDEYQNAPAQPQKYGDGRGPSKPMRWGETEDHLYVPAAVADGPGGRGADLEVAAGVIVQDGLLDDNAGTVQSAATSAISRGLNLQLHTRNLGDRIAGGTVLEIEMEPYLGIPGTQGVECCRCLTCTVASNVQPLPHLTDIAEGSSKLPFQEVCEDDQCKLQLALGDLPPGDRIGLILGWPWPWKGSENRVDFKVKAISSNHTGSGNNARQLSALRLYREPVITAPSPGAWTGCLTCTVAFKGFAEPGSQVSIFSDGFESGDTSAIVGPDGFWEIDAYLPDGIHQIEMGWIGCLTCTRQLQAVAAAGMAAEMETVTYNEMLDITVDRSLLWNPNSFGYTRETLEHLNAAAVDKDDDSCGPWSIVDDAGRMDLNGWKIPVWSGKEIEMGVELFCAGQGGAALRYGGQEVAFGDSDGDGYFSARFTPQIGDSGQDGVDVELEVSCDGRSALYTGSMVPVTPIIVSDSETGKPLAGLDVQLFSQLPGAETPQYAPWEAHAYGQINPQTTDENGAFSYVVPRGRYGLLITGDGYQPFRSGPFRTSGPLTGFNIGMPPTIVGARTQVIQITEDGFLPATLEIEPDTIVEWQNFGLEVASAQSTAGTAAAALEVTTWDSGILQSGEVHRVRFNRIGTYTYVDAEDPSKDAVVKVVIPSEVDHMVFLPYVLK